MSIPPLSDSGFLPPGIYLASLDEVVARFGTENPTRAGFARLLTEIIGAARNYPSIKRILVWGSFISAKSEPGDLDYSIVVSIDHRQTRIAPEHHRFFLPNDARMFYGVDKRYLELQDFEWEQHAEHLDFISLNRLKSRSGVVEMQVYGECLFTEQSKEPTDGI